MISGEKKFLLSLIDLGLYDTPKAIQLLDKYTFDYENDFNSPVVRLGVKSSIACLKNGNPPILDLVVSSAIKIGATQAEAEALKGSLSDWSGYSIGFDGYAKEVIDAGDKRRLLKTVTEAVNNIANPKMKASDVLSRISKDAFRSRDARTFKKLSSYSKGIVDNVTGGVIATKVIRTGIKELDKVIGGWQPTLNLMGAEPGVGKTALMSASVDAISARGVKVGFFSLEDEPSFMSYRYLSSESGINQFKLRFDKLTPEEISKIIRADEKSKIYQDNIYMVDGSDRPMSAEDIVATANDLVFNHGVEILFVDHLGELTSKHSDRVDLEISDQLSTLRRIANRLGIPVVVACHFRRPSGGGRIIKPVLTDFANSAGAERKARVALGLTREPGSDRLNIHILKQTNGPSGMIVDVVFDGAAAMILSTEGGLQ